MHLSALILWAAALDQYQSLSLTLAQRLESAKSRHWIVHKKSPH